MCISHFLVRFNDLLVVSGGKSGSTLAAFNTTTLSFSSVWTSSRTIQHGAGIALDAATGTLYVVEQDTSSVLKFRVSNGNYISSFLTNLEDAPEQIFFTSC
jgi:DNA-binding beta-propeller fold protein YncE